MLSLTSPLFRRVLDLQWCIHLGYSPFFGRLAVALWLFVANFSFNHVSSPWWRIASSSWYTLRWLKGFAGSGVISDEVKLCELQQWHSGKSNVPKRFASRQPHRTIIPVLRTQNFYIWGRKLQLRIWDATAVFVNIRQPWSFRLSSNLLSASSRHLPRGSSGGSSNLLLTSLHLPVWDGRFSCYRRMWRSPSSRKLAWRSSVFRMALLTVVTGLRIRRRKGGVELGSGTVWRPTEKELVPSSKIVGAYPLPPQYRNINPTGHNKRHSLGPSQLVRSDDPLRYILSDLYTLPFLKMKVGWESRSFQNSPRVQLATQLVAETKASSSSLPLKKLPVRHSSYHLCLI